MTVRLILVCFVLAAAPVSGVRGETVFVAAAFAEKANGWLFGSRIDRSCWIAFPWHLVDRSGGEGGLRYFDQSGRAGETGRPARAVKIEGVQAAPGLEDLAFARVTSGRRAGECPSRLGLPSSFAFADALRAGGPLQLTFMQEGTFRRMEMEHTLATADAERGSLLLLRPRSPRDLGFLQKGISGSVAEVDWHGRLRPAAMVLGEAGAGAEAVRALRFDRIRTAFEALEAQHAGPGTEPAAAERLGFAVVSLAADVRDGSAQLTALSGQGTCWRAAPPAGSRAVELVLEVAEAGRRLGSLVLAAAPDCAPPARAIVEGREPGALWEVLSSGCQAGPEPQLCRINRAAPYEIRLKLLPQAGFAGLSRIALQ
ncbi:hypothetical protein [Cribrihabitans neustonicus]|uniref:hypothetical protein n=1 Tax=Cribrihabitans neustonicus TaxID=1429085 RepID=UPI003B5AA2E6